MNGSAPQKLPKDNDFQFLELGRANPQADQLQNGSKREVTERQGHDASGTQVRTVQFYMVTVRLQETANAGEALARARSAQTHSSGHLRQKPTPEPPAEDRQPATFMIGQSQSSPAQLRLQNPVFLFGGTRCATLLSTRG